MCEQIITKKTGKDFIKEFLIDKIGKLKENEYNGRVSAQLYIEDIAI